MNTVPHLILSTRAEKNAFADKINMDNSTNIYYFFGDSATGKTVTYGKYKANCKRFEIDTDTDTNTDTNTEFLDHIRSECINVRKMYTDTYVNITAFIMSNRYNPEVVKYFPNAILVEFVNKEN